MGMKQKTADLIQKGIRGLVILLPAVSLFGSFIRLFRIPFLGWTTGMLLAIYLLLILSIALFVLRRSISVPFGSSLQYCLFFILMMLYATISFLWVRNPKASFNIYLYQLIGVIMVLSIAAAVRNLRDLSLLLDMLAICYIVVVVLGIYEIFTGRYLFSPTNPEIRLKNAYHLFFPYAAFNNTNDYASYVTLFLPFTAYTITGRIRGPFGYLAAGALCIASLFTLFSSDARACYIAVALMTLAFLVCAACKRTNLGKMRKMIPAVLGGLCGIMLICFAFVVKIKVVIHEIKSLSPSNHSVGERLMLMQSAFRMIISSRFMGVGVGNSAQMVPYFSASIRPLNLHNMTLQILTEYGIIIFTFYIMMLVSLAVRFFKYNGQDFRRNVLSCVCFTVLCAYPVVGVASSDTTHVLPLWIVLGIFLGSVKLFYPKDQLKIPMFKNQKGSR